MTASPFANPSLDAVLVALSEALGELKIAEARAERLLGLSSDAQQALAEAREMVDLRRREALRLLSEQS
jgi:hypothetical protein